MYSANSSRRGVTQERISEDTSTPNRTQEAYVDAYMRCGHSRAAAEAMVDLVRENVRQRHLELEERAAVKRLAAAMSLEVRR